MTYGPGGRSSSTASSRNASWRNIMTDAGKYRGKRKLTAIVNSPEMARRFAAALRERAWVATATGNKVRANAGMSTIRNVSVVTGIKVKGVQ